MSWYLVNFTQGDAGVPCSAYAQKRTPLGARREVHRHFGLYQKVRVTSVKRVKNAK